MSKTRLACGLVVLLLSVSTITSGQAPSGPPSTAKGDWPYYTADIKGTKYSPLDQINAGNFGKLEVAWRFKTDMLGPRPEYKLEGTPLAINGVLYTTGGTRRSVVALDGEDRRADLGAQPARRAARRRRAAPAVGPRRLVLDRRQAATSASSTSRPAIGWSRSTRRPDR